MMANLFDDYRESYWPPRHVKRAWLASHGADSGRLSQHAIFISDAEAI